jgi:hypothetical protein
VQLSEALSQKSQNITTITTRRKKLAGVDGQQYVTSTGLVSLFLNAKIPVHYLLR